MSDERARFIRHLLARVQDVLDDVPAADRSDTYVVHLTAMTDSDDYRRVIVPIAWNTTAHMKESRNEPSSPTGR